MVCPKPADKPYVSSVRERGCQLTSPKPDVAFFLSFERLEGMSSKFRSSESLKLIQNPRRHKALSTRSRICSFQLLLTSGRVPLFGHHQQQWWQGVWDLFYRPLIRVIDFSAYCTYNCTCQDVVTNYGCQQCKAVKELWGSNHIFIQ